MTTRITIDRIVLDGFGYSLRDRAGFEASLVAELGRGPEQPDPPVPPPGRAATDARTSPESLGATVARAVRRTIKP